MSGTSFMMTSSSDGYLNIWDVRRPPAPLHTTTPDRSPILAVRNLPGTNTFAVSTTKGLYLFDGVTNSISRVGTVQLAGFPSLQWDLNTGTLYAASGSSIATFRVLLNKK
jgi:WD40 repeat protein